MSRPLQEALSNALSAINTRRGGNGQLRRPLTCTRFLGWSRESSQNCKDRDQRGSHVKNAAVAGQERPHLMDVKPHGNLLLRPRWFGRGVCVDCAG
jgi:hypothetical protein